jgi:SPX domain protein involved in polyphosphate accumulation
MDVLHELAQPVVRSVTTRVSVQLPDAAEVT